MIYSMNEGERVAQLAATDIEAWVRSRSETVSVRNLENDLFFQNINVYLILAQKGS